MKVKDPQGVYDLPLGTLWMTVPWGTVQASFSAENVTDAAEVVAAHDDPTDFTSQAQVIARAGNRYNWGFGRKYRAA